MKIETYKLFESFQKNLKENTSMKIKGLNKLNEYYGDELLVHEGFILEGNIPYIDSNCDKAIDDVFKIFERDVVNKYDLVRRDFGNWKNSTLEHLKNNVHEGIDDYKSWNITTNLSGISKLYIKFTLERSTYVNENLIASFTVTLEEAEYKKQIAYGDVDYIDKESYKIQKEKEEREERKAIEIEKIKNDGSKYYYLLSDGYLQEIEKDEKYYDDDPNTWTCSNAETIKTAHKFKSYNTADKFLDKRYDYYTGNYRIEGLSDDTQIVSLNQLISGEVSTSTDLLSYKNTTNSTVDNTQQEEPEETDDTISDKFSYTLTAEDGKTFTYTEDEYKNPEEMPDYEDMPIWDEAVKYSDSKGFTTIVSKDADRYITWKKDEDGEWELQY